MNAENADKTFFAHVFSKNPRSSAFISVQKSKVSVASKYSFKNYHLVKKPPSSFRTQGLGLFI